MSVPNEAGRDAEEVFRNHTFHMELLLLSVKNKLLAELIDINGLNAFGSGRCTNRWVNFSVGNQQPPGLFPEGAFE